MITLLDYFRNKLIEQLVGHPQTVETKYTTWNPDYVRGDNRLALLLMSGKQIAKDYALKEKRYKSRSFLLQYAQLHQVFMAETSGSIQDITNAARTIGTPSTVANVHAMAATATDSGYGLVVGSNATAVTRTDVDLNTLIAHGATASTLAYGACTIGAVTNPSGSISQFLIQRTFTGNTGSTVTIREDGIRAKSRDTGSTVRTFCTERFIPTAFPVAAAQVVTVTKTWSITS